MKVIHIILEIIGLATLTLCVAVGWQDYWEQRTWEKRKLAITLRKQREGEMADED